MFVTQSSVCDALTRAMGEATRLAAEGMEALTQPPVESGWHLVAAAEDRVMLARLVHGFHFRMTYQVAHECIVVTHVELVIREGCQLTLCPTPDPKHAFVQLFGLSIAATHLDKAIMPVDLTHAEMDASLAFMSIITSIVRA